ncbi:MAG: VOC family protein [Cyanobacteria bacterium P01_D01_bin.105]
MTDRTVCSEVFVALSSLQVSVLANFYKGLVGTEPKVNVPSYAEFQLTGLRLAIFAPKEENAAEFEGRSSGAMSLCVEVEDLEQAIAHLIDLGYPPSGKIMHTSHGQEIYAYDPDGNRLILHQSSG